MVSDIIWHDSEPSLRRPLLLIAFEGLFDAAEAATSALTWIEERTDSTLMAEIDAETFFNFQEVRPMVRLDESGQRVIDWPTTRLWACRTEDERDLLVMTGVEPHLRWRGFADCLVEIARRSHAEMVVTVGAMVSMVPHTRPFPITGSASDPDLAGRLQLSLPSYQGPTGVVGVVNQRVHEAGLPIISLRASIPHYLPGPPNPKATQALLRRIEQTARVRTGYEELDADVAEWVQRVDAAVVSDDESRAYVSKLEQQVDSDEELLPSGDDLAAELEAFLRDRGDEAGEGGSEPGEAPSPD